jgi:hypothetical protein
MVQDCIPDFAGVQYGLPSPSVGYCGVIYLGARQEQEFVDSYFFAFAKVRLFEKNGSTLPSNRSFTWFV